MRGVAYKTWIPRVRTQATSNADREHCAMVAAYASHARGEPLLGIMRGDPDGPAKIASVLLNKYGVQPANLALWVAAINGEQLGSALVPPVLGGMTLESYQVDAVARMSPAGGVMALGCGLGKTLAACAFAHAIDAKTTVVICPLNAMPTWKRYAPMLPGGVLVHSMDSAHHLKGMMPPDLIIFDEAHLQGHATTARTKVAHELRRRARAGLCLTGTLLHAGIIKTLSVLDLAIPGASQFGNRWAAGEHFSCLVRKNIGGRNVTDLGPLPITKRAEFHAYLARHVVALTPDSASVRAVLQLPGQTVADVPIAEPWPPIEQAAADYVRAAMAAGTAMPSAAETAHALCSAGADYKTDWVIQNLAAEPVVIFAQYTATLYLMEQKLKAAGITYVRVDGNVTGLARVQAQELFQAGQVQVFLGQMVAAGISMDLFRTPYSIAIDHPWRTEAYAQALARTHRRGQSIACHHWDLVANQLQKRIVHKLRAGEAFNAETAEWQQVKAGQLVIDTACTTYTNP